MENGRIERLVALNKIALSEEETLCVHAFFDARAREAERLSQIDTKDTPPTVHVNPVPCVLREDEVEQLLSREEMQSVSSSIDAGFWFVPRVLE
jgi:aspartyl-tRNA(Asn)/glutamyl-tRNA(Gln) amidotransferase subunit C